jgi:hypothetical protein
MPITSKRAWKLLGTRPTTAAARGRRRELGCESMRNYIAAPIAVDSSRAAPPAFAPLHRSDQTRRGHDLFLNQATTTVRVMAAQRHHGGRPAKGDRQALLSRVPTPLGEAVKAQADMRDMTVSDYIAALLAQSLGMPELVSKPLAVIPTRQELPIADVA